MTNNSEQYTQFFQQGQDALRNAVGTWTDTVRTVAGQVPTPASQFDAEAAIDRYFDLNEQALEAQRDLAKRVLATVSAVAGTVKA